MSANKKATKGNKKKSFKVTSAKEKRFKCAPRRIPEDILKDTLKKLENPNDRIWLGGNKSCVPGIDSNSVHEPFLSSEMTTKLKTARQCLLRRDWPNLAKTLTTNCFKETQGHAASVFPIFAKYSTLCLMYNDSTRLNTFLKTILASKDPVELMELCTSYP